MSDLLSQTPRASTASLQPPRSSVGPQVWDGGGLILFVRPNLTEGQGLAFSGGGGVMGVMGVVVMGVVVPMTITMMVLVVVARTRSPLLLRRTRRPLSRPALPPWAARPPAAKFILAK